jgi:hypothetical protein
VTGEEAWTEGDYEFSTIEIDLYQKRIDLFVICAAMVKVYLMLRAISAVMHH